MNQFHVHDKASSDGVRRLPFDGCERKKLEGQPNGWRKDIRWLNILQKVGKRDYEAVKAGARGSNTAYTSSPAKEAFERFKGQWQGA